jgi:hypothetical protein
VGLAQLPLNLGARERGRVAVPVDDRELAPLATGRGGKDCIFRLLGSLAPGEKVERHRPEPRIGEVLREHRASGGTGVAAARPDRERRRGHDRAEHSGSGAAPDKREVMHHPE